MSTEPHWGDAGHEAGRKPRRLVEAARRQGQEGGGALAAGLLVALRGLRIFGQRAFTQPLKRRRRTLSVRPLVADRGHPSPACEGGRATAADAQTSPATTVAASSPVLHGSSSEGWGRNLQQVRPTEAVSAGLPATAGRQDLAVIVQSRASRTTGWSATRAVGRRLPRRATPHRRTERVRPEADRCLPTFIVRPSAIASPLSSIVAAPRTGTSPRPQMTASSGRDLLSGVISSRPMPMSEYPPARRHSGEPTTPAPLPPELAAFLRTQDVVALLHASNAGPLYAAKAPEVELEPRRPVPVELDHQLCATPRPRDPLPDHLLRCPDRRFAWKASSTSRDPDQR